MVERLKLGLIVFLFLCFLLKADIVIDKSKVVYIIISEKTSETEKFAADELKKYLNLICGVESFIVKENDALKGVRFYIGKNKFTEKYLTKFDNSVAGPGKDSFFIKAKNDEIILVGGGDRGTLYSVYEFLEQQGCRWFMPGKLGEVIPKKEKIIVKEGEKLYVPDFIQREITIGGGPGITYEEIIDWCAKNKINRNFNIGCKSSRKKEVEQFWKIRGGELNWQHVSHNYKFILPPEKYFKEHPEYYALYKGERVPLGNDKGNVCTTNPDVMRIFTDFIIDWFTKNPDGSVFPLSPPDGKIRWCECPECQKLGGINFMPGEKGSMSRRQVVFVNEIAKRVYEKFPDRYLLLLSYHETSDPVPDLKLEKNVIVQICHHGCLAHPINKCEANKRTKERIEGWTKMADPNSGSPGIWDYFLLQVDNMSGPCYAPLPFAYTAAENIKYLKKLGSKYYFTQAGPVQIHNPLPFYVIAKFTWDVNTDFEKLLDDFCEKFYEESSEPMKKYWKLLEEAVQNSDWHPTSWTDVTIPSPKVFTKDVLEKGEKYLSDAEKLAKNDIVKERIKLARQSFDYAKSVVAQKSSWKLERGENFYTINAEGNEDDEKKVSLLIEQKKNYGDPDGSLSRLIFRLKKRKVPIIKLENERLEIAVIPGIGGRIIRIIDKKTKINFMHEPSETSLLNVGAFYFDYGGYEEYVGKLFASPGWEKEYEYSFKEDEKFKYLILKTEIQPFSLERTITIEKGNSPEVSIKSILTNKGENKEKIMLRIHPEMTLGKGETDSWYIYFRSKDGKFKKISVSSIMEEQPDGFWAAVDESKNIGIINYFDPQQAKTYLYYDPDRKFFNMELMSEEKVLNPGESIVINHKYRVVDDAKKELPIIESQDSIKEIEKIQGNINFGKGVVNQSGFFDGKSYLSYNAEKTIKANSGTIEFWIKPYHSPSSIDFEPIISVGQNYPSWFLIALGKNKLEFLYKRGKKPYKEEGEFYSYISVGIDDWKENEWHHIGIVWANLEKEKSIMQIYIDGVLKESRFDCSIGEEFDTNILGIGYNTAAILGNKFYGEIDELRISNYPKTGKEIKESYNRGLKGEPLIPEKGTLLLLHFDGNTTGISRTTEKLSKEKIKFYVDEILKEIN